MSANYYTEDNMVLRFKITDETGDVVPSAATVELLNPLDEWVELGDATIASNQVSIVIPVGETTNSGNYMALFNLTLPGPLIKQHKMVFTLTDKLTRL